MVEHSQQERTHVALLFDVSGSMEGQFSSSESGSHDINNETLRLPIDLVNDLARKKLSPNDKITPVVFGSRLGDVVDFYQVLKYFSTQGIIDVQQRANQNMYREVYGRVLSRVPSLEIYYTFYQLQSDFNVIEICHVCKYFENRNNFENFINQLPSFVFVDGKSMGAIGMLTMFAVHKIASSSEGQKQEVQQYVRDLKSRVINQIKPMFEISKEQLAVSSHNVSEVIQTLQKFSHAKNNELVKAMEKELYGSSTPMKEAIEQVVKQFRSNQSQRRYLIIVSDGEPNTGCPSAIAESLKKDLNVKIITIFITKTNEIDPKTLIYEAPSNLSAGAKLMHSMSSELSNTDRALRILACKNNWKLSTTGSSKLFIQVCNLDLLKELIDVFMDVTGNNDSLLDLIGQVDLDAYMQSGISKFDAKNQIGGTCWANALAAAFYLASKRILEREGGHPKFDVIVKDLLAQEGIFQYDAKTEGLGRDTLACGIKYAPRYRLHAKEINEEGARQAINRGRTVVVRFEYSAQQWYNFGQFFQTNPKGILDSNTLNEPRSAATLANETPGGHAVLFTSYDTESMRFLNSWDKIWADKGFFKVKNSAVLCNIRYLDVYWLLTDLTPWEKQAYAQKSDQILKEHTECMRGTLENVKFHCPSCQQLSYVQDFDGNLSLCTCPKCRHTFKPMSLGKIFTTMNYEYGQKK